MTKGSKFERFEELDAGRALGDLDRAELAEWMALADELGLGPGLGLDGFAAELEVALGGEAEPLPADIAARLKATIPAAKVVPFEAPAPQRKQAVLPGLAARMEIAYRLCESEPALASLFIRRTDGRLQALADIARASMGELRGWILAPLARVLLRTGQ